MKKSGRVLLTVELGKEYDFKDIDGSTPLNMRQLKTLCMLTGHTWMAAILPSFLKIPFWLWTLGAGKF